MSMSHVYGPDGNLNVTNNGLTEARPAADRPLLLDEIDEGTVGVPNGDGSTQELKLLPARPRFDLHHGRFRPTNAGVTGSEFIRKLKALGKTRRVTVVLDDASRGKGSHQTLYFGSAFTIVRNSKDELKNGTFHAMCSQLDIKPGGP